MRLPEQLITPEELFGRAENLGYAARRQFLAQGEAALVADPIESPEWYVDYPESILKRLSDPAELQRMKDVAASIIEFSNGLIV